MLPIRARTPGSVGTREFRILNHFTAVRVWPALSHRSAMCQITSIDEGTIWCSFSKSPSADAWSPSRFETTPRL